MKTLVVYATKYGATTKAVEILKTHLKSEVVIVNLKEETHPPLSEFDAVIFGSAVYMGTLRKEARTFMRLHEDELLSKKLGLFLCCGQKESAEELAQKNFPQKIWQNAAAFGFFGYAYQLEKMNFFERLILKKAAGLQDSVWNIEESNIKEFARQLK